jgi:hypothetical protein
MGVAVQILGITVGQVRPQVVAHGQPFGNRRPVDAVAVDGAAGDIDIVQFRPGPAQQAEQPDQFGPLSLQLFKKGV